MAAEKSICTVCLENEMKRGLMCRNCYKAHEEEVVAAVSEHKAVQTQVEFAMAKTSGNLSDLKNKLISSLDQTKPFFNQAYGEVKAECRGVRLESEIFINLVKARCNEILHKAGHDILADRVEWLHRVIHSCEEKVSWYKKLIKKQTDEEAEWVAANVA